MPIHDQPTEQDDYARQVELTAAYTDGQQAYRDYVRYVQNPHRGDPELADQWCNGWLVAENEAHGA